MKLGIGIDLVDPEEVLNSVLRHGQRYLERVYTRCELQECRGDISRLAARFAAKEATMKALRRQDEPVDWRSIEVQEGESGPSLRLRGQAAGLARRRGLNRFSVSLTQSTSAVTAVVLARG